MNATEQTTLAAAQAAVQEAQRRVDDLLQAQQMLERQLPEAQSVLRAAHAALRRICAPASRIASRKAELDFLKQQIAAVTGEHDHAL